MRGWGILISTLIPLVRMVGRSFIVSDSREHIDGVRIPWVLKNKHEDS